jgi:ethanolamine transporter EutH
MCHRASESTAWQCGCGYEFGQDIDTLITIDLGILAITIITALTGAGLIPGLGFAFLLAATGRTIRKIAISRESLRQLAPRELPTARLLT